MPKERPPQARVVFDGEMRRRFETVKKYYGLEKNADLVRLLVTQKFEELKKEDVSLEHQFKMLNHDDRGVKIWDNKLGKDGASTHVQITPKGIYCVACDASKCEHVRFALGQPDIQEIVRQKQKDGWKIVLPDES